MTLADSIPAPCGDETLIARARSGDAAACETLVRKHRQAAYLLALQLLRNREDALDVTQDALIRLLSTLHRFDPKRPVKPWLYRIVRNLVIDLRRRQRVRRHDSLDERNEDGGPKLQPVDPTADPEDDAARTQLRRHLWEALADLTQPHREILVLRDYHDLSYREIAETLDVPIGTVMSRLHAARRQLRARVADDLQHALGKGDPR